MQRCACAGLVVSWLAAAASAQTTPAQAPPPDAPAPASVPAFRTDVVVTAERGAADQAWVPAATVAVDAALLRTLPAQSVGEFLSFIPGFRVQQPDLVAGRPVVSARGFFGGGEAEYVALLVDGVRVADAESGLVDWAMLAGSSVARIDAARGPGASLYGDASIGGVVQVLTDSASKGNTFTLSGGSPASVSFDGTSRWRGTSTGGLVSGSARRTSGISDHSDASELTFGTAIDGRLRIVQWRWTANVVDRRQQDPGVLSVAQRESGVSFDPLFRFDNRNRRSVLTAVTLRSAGAVWTQQSRVSADIRDEDGIRTILLAPGLADTRSRTLDTTGMAGSIELGRTLAGKPNSALRVGVDVDRHHLDTAYRAVQDGQPSGDVLGQAIGARVRAGAFASASWMPASRVRLSGALRWDRIADGRFGRADGASSTQAWSPRAGIVVQPRWLAGASLFGQASRAFKAPTLDQMFDPRPYPDFRGGTFTISNAQLTAQRASNVEAGVSKAGMLRWSVLGYRMNVDNEIDFDARTFSYANIGRSRHTGFEADVMGTATARVRPLASYVLSKVVDASEPSNAQLKNVPRHQVTLGAGATLGWKIDAFASVRRAWGAYLDDENTRPVHSRPLLDLRVRRSIRSALLFVDLLNATNERYDEFGYVLTDFRGGRVGYVYPGQPRIARVGLTLGAR